MIDPRDLAKFKADLARLMDDVVLPQTQEAIRALAVEIHTDIKFETPVLEGHLRASWQAALGTPNLETRTAEEGDVDADEALPRLVPLDRVIWITNAQPYAIPIEYGHSRIKAPQGMVRITLRRILAKYRQ